MMFNIAIRISALIAAIMVPSCISAALAQDPYFPGRWDIWETRTPEQVGMNSVLLNEAVQYAKSAANNESKDLEQVIAASFGNEPFNTIIGPTQPRGDANGMIVRRGYIVAQWGDVDRVDMTFSVTKSYLSTVAGLALEDGLIRDLNDPLAGYVRDGKFDSDHNSQITWEHLLQQTSDWSGELWEKPDWCDRPVGLDSEKWPNREMHLPGTHFKYNDVRVNLLAFCLTSVLRKPLPVVLRERIMDPIGGFSNLALARLRKLLDHTGRPENPVGQRGRALGWRNVHVYP